MSNPPGPYAYNGGYPPQQPYYQPQPYLKPQGPRRPGPAGLGVAGILLSLVALALSLIWDFIFVDQIWNLDTVSATPEDTDPIVSAVVWAIVMQIVASVIGVTALVLSIVGVSLNRGRVAGIFGIIVAALAPIISYVTFLIVLTARGLDSDNWNDDGYTVSAVSLLIHLVA